MSPKKHDSPRKGHPETLRSLYLKLVAAHMKSRDCAKVFVMVSSLLFFAVIRLSHVMSDVLMSAWCR